MTKAELEQKINDINTNSNDSAEEKARRINQLNAVYTNVQKQAAEAAERMQQDAERHLKSGLKEAYMSNPVATLEDFERDYPQLKGEFLRNEAMKKDAIIRGAAASAYREAF